jgi:hypothetical protein
MINLPKITQFIHLNIPMALYKKTAVTVEYLSVKISKICSDSKITPFNKISIKLISANSENLFIIFLFTWEMIKNSENMKS